MDWKTSQYAREHAHDPMPAPAVKPWVLAIIATLKQK
jgi:hypothetical protein